VFDPLRSIKAAPFDPLRAPASPTSASAPVATPLSPRSTPSSGGEGKEEKEVKEGKEVKKRRPGEFEPFKEKKPRVLQTYTTSKTMAVSANFLDDDVKEAAAGPKAVDQSKSRLEQLELDAGQTDAAKSMMTQKEYIAHIEEQHERLKTAWDSGERVVSLKIAIQCAKLLGDTSVPQFYPSMFILLTDILDTFGDLVFNRYYLPFFLYCHSFISSMLYLLAIIVSSVKVYQSSPHQVKQKPLHCQLISNKVMSLQVLKKHVAIGILTHHLFVAMANS
jgi:hypothetical protein